MPERIEKLRDVFGVGREKPLNYVEREDVDSALVKNLTRDKHVVIYGSSKQGKTTLRKHCLSDEDYIVVSCLNTMALDDLHAAILKAAGYRIEQSQTRTVGGRWKYGAEFKGEGKVPFLASAVGGGSVERETESEEETQTTRLEIDLADVNDVIAALLEIKFEKFIVLEDFHYLPVDVQQTFSFALKAYHENSNLCFIIVGVWREKNRLIYYNGDLTNRVVSVDVDVWKRRDLEEVISAGSTILNVGFEKDFINTVLSGCFDSVSLVQEAFYKLCEKEGVLETQENYRVIGGGFDGRDLIKDIVNEQAGRYSAFINNVAEGFQKTEYEMYKWLIYVIISTKEDLEGGLRRAQVSAAIKERHPMKKKLNEGNITQALQNVASLQIQKSIRPIIFDYDQTTRVLHVVDKSFLIWLAYQNVEELISELGIQTDDE